MPRFTLKHVFWGVTLIAIELGLFVAMVDSSTVGFIDPVIISLGWLAFGGYAGMKVLVWYKGISSGTIWLGATIGMLLQCFIYVTWLTVFGPTMRI